MALPTNVLSLCAGGGGLDRGVRLALPDARTVGYVENEVTACGVLVSNMEAGGLDDAPVWTDLRTFDGTAWRGVVDLVIGGYPCQPFSNAGKRLGDADPRHLWPDVRRIVGEVQPERCFFENVGAHLRLGFREVARDLQGMGYRVAAVLLTAEEIGAPHGRERLFILADRSGLVQREPQHAASPEPRGDTRQDVGGGSRPGDAQLADTERGSGSTEPREQHPQWPEAAPRAGGADDAADVADASRFSGQVSASGTPNQARGGIAAGAGAADDGASDSVGDADLARLEGWVGTERGGFYELPAWPPSPDDDEGWTRVVAAGRLDLLPATPQPEVRGVADGLGRKLGRHRHFIDAARGIGLSDWEAEEAYGDWLRGRGLARSDRLHVLGNGVVPQQAAYAMTLLLEAMAVSE